MDKKSILKEVVVTQEMEGILVKETTKQIIRDCILGEKSFEKARKEAIERFKTLYLDGDV